MPSDSLRMLSFFNACFMTAALQREQQTKASRITSDSPHMGTRELPLSRCHSAEPPQRAIHFHASPTATIKP